MAETLGHGVCCPLNPGLTRSDHQEQAFASTTPWHGSIRLEIPATVIANDTPDLGQLGLAWLFQLRPSISIHLPPYSVSLLSLPDPMCGTTRSLGTLARIDVSSQSQTKRHSASEQPPASLSRPAKQGCQRQNSVQTGKGPRLIGWPSTCVFETNLSGEISCKG